jgi:hypothetical protein
MASQSELGTFTVQGPVQAEIMVLAVYGGELVLTGPCGAAPWYVDVAKGADPLQTVTAITKVNVGSPALVHSTSWRHARGGVVLTFIAVMDAADVGTLSRMKVERSELVRGEATSAPGLVPAEAVIEHGLRHLAWLTQDDPVIAAALPTGWFSTLNGYVPEPFRQL